MLYIYELQVSPNFQRKGLGAALVQISERLGRMHQMGGVALTCFKHNTNAMAFYSALGYSPIDTSPGECDPIGDPEECNYEIIAKLWDEPTREQLTLSGKLGCLEALLGYMQEAGQVLVNESSGHVAVTDAHGVEFDSGESLDHVLLNCKWLNALEDLGPNVCLNAECLKKYKFQFV